MFKAKKVRRTEEVRDLRRAAVMWENLHTGPANTPKSNQMALLKKLSSSSLRETLRRLASSSSTNSSSSSDDLTLEISPPFNAKPGPSSHFQTARRIVPPPEPTPTPPPEDLEDGYDSDNEHQYQFNPIRISITYPARRPLSAVTEVEETLSMFIRSDVDAQSTSFSLSSPTFTDELLNSALEDSLGSATTRNSIEFNLRSLTGEENNKESEIDENALGLSLASSPTNRNRDEEDTDEDERRAELQIGFGTLPDGGASSGTSNAREAPPAMPLRRQRRQIQSHSKTSSLSGAAIPSAAVLLSVLQTPKPFGPGFDTSVVSVVPRPRIRRGDPLPPLFLYGHLATPALLTLLLSHSGPNHGAKPKQPKFEIQSARLYQSSSSTTPHFDRRTISQLEWPVLVKTKTKHRPIDPPSPSTPVLPIDGVLLHNLSRTDRRRIKLLHPQFEGPTATGDGTIAISLFHRTLVQVHTRDGHPVEAVAFVWREDATEKTGLRLVTEEEQRIQLTEKRRKMDAPPPSKTMTGS